MFERFTDQARKAVVLAQEEARLFGHNYIGTDHLLLELTGREDSEVVTILRALGADPAQLRAGVLEEIGKHPENLEHPPPLRSRPASVHARPDQVQALLGRIEERLSAIERHLGIDPGEDGPTGPENVIPPS
jgi:ATP-dependent Clp protease ATP-binding subunit ClpC